MSIIHIMSVDHDSSEITWLPCCMFASEFWYAAMPFCESFSRIWFMQETCAAAARAILMGNSESLWSVPISHATSYLIHCYPCGPAEGSTRQWVGSEGSGRFAASKQSLSSWCHAVPLSAAAVNRAGSRREFGLLQVQVPTGWFCFSWRFAFQAFLMRHPTLRRRRTSHDLVGLCS